MESKWLEDFISLAETQNFRRSAELRHVSQPAFSRRIQSLEAWLGVDLVDRTTSPPRLTVAGQIFRVEAREMLAQIHHMRALLRAQQPVAPATVDFAVPHALSLTFMPKWLTELNEGFGAIRSRLKALNVVDTVQILADGNADLLICYHHPSQPVQLDAARYEMMVLGHEWLRPYVRCGRDGQSQHSLPGSAGAPVPFLSYTPDAYLGRMVEQILADPRRPLHLEKRYETDMAEGLKMMALEGHGVAFLPASTVVRELKLRQLTRADGECNGWALEMEIRIYRERPTAGRPGKLVVAQLWDYLLRQRSSRAVTRKTAGEPRVRLAYQSPAAPAPLRLAAEY